jgi:hypothetical protein
VTVAVRVIARREYGGYGILWQMDFMLYHRQANNLTLNNPSTTDFSIFQTLTAQPFQVDVAD